MVRQRIRQLQQRAIELEGQFVVSLMEMRAAVRAQDYREFLATGQGIQQRHPPGSPTEARRLSLSRATPLSLASASASASASRALPPLLSTLPPMASQDSPVSSSPVVEQARRRASESYEHRRIEQHRAITALLTSSGVTPQPQAGEGMGMIAGAPVSASAGTHSQLQSAGSNASGDASRPVVLPPSAPSLEQRLQEGAALGILCESEHVTESDAVVR